MKYSPDRRWRDNGPDPAPYCQDCQRPCNDAREVVRAGHYLYVCPACAEVRTAAPPLPKTLSQTRRETGNNLYEHQRSSRSSEAGGAGNGTPSHLAGNGARRA